MSAPMPHGPEIARLRAILGTYNQGTHSVCTVRQDDLRAALSLIDALVDCCDGRQQALARVAQRAADEEFCAAAVDFAGMTPTAEKTRGAA